MKQGYNMFMVYKNDLKTFHRWDTERFWSEEGDILEDGIFNSKFYLQSQCASIGTGSRHPSLGEV